MTTPSEDPRVAAHLAAVAEALAGDPNAATVLEHLRSHIAEAFESHAAAPDPAAAVLAELDPPAAYRSQATSTTTPGGRLGWWSFLLSLAAPLSGVITGVIATAAGGTADIGWLVFTAIDLAALVGGLVAWRQPWGRTAVACALGVYTALLVLSAF